MPVTAFRVVIDTLFRGLAKAESAAGKGLHAIETRGVLFLTSRAVVGEYRKILPDPLITGHYPSPAPKAIEASIRKLVCFADHFDVV
jgi:hypothetical protein